MNYTTVDRIIAKIDNDFNPNNSDWIPRVGAWVYDALMQLDCIQTETVRKRLTVKDRIARSDCPLPEDIKMYDENCCEIPELTKLAGGCCGGRLDSGLNNNNENDDNANGVKSSHSSTGDRRVTHRTITRGRTGETETIESVAFHVNVPVSYPPRYNVIEVKKSERCNRGYVRIDNKTFELNFDANYVTIEYQSPKMIPCSYYNCSAPAIPDNGKAIEAITYYCMYKMLTRGYVHPVMNLAASQYGTNPYYIWMQSKEEAKRSIIIDGANQALDDLWRSAFYINTFNPRGKS